MPFLTLTGSRWSIAHGRRDFEIPIEGDVLDVGVIEADIANADPRFEFEEEDQDATNTEIVNDD